MLVVIYADCYAECYAECHNAECRYAECHYEDGHSAECRGAEKNAPAYLTKEKKVFFKDWHQMKEIDAAQLDWNRDWNNKTYVNINKKIANI